jgi:hypothetical protein
MTDKQHTSGDSKQAAFLKRVQRAETQVEREARKILQRSTDLLYQPTEKASSELFKTIVRSTPAREDDLLYRVFKQRIDQTLKEEEAIFKK